MKRRALACSLILALAAPAFAGAARAQQPDKVYRLGWLSSYAGKASRTFFLQGMRDHGYIEGKNLVIEARYARGHIDRFPALAGELVTLNPDCIVTIGVAATRAAERATTRIPIVMGNVADDPVRQGLVASFAHPGGNVTGMTNIGADLAGKRLGLLRDLIPGLSRVAILWQPNAPASTADVRKTEAAAATIGVKIERLPIRTAKDLDGAFRKAAASGVQAVIAPNVGVANSYGPKIAGLAIAARLPLMTTYTPVAVAGALISYDGDMRERYRDAAGYVARIFKGAKPADLPVMRPSKFTLVVNLKTAKAIGIAVPRSVLLRANRVIR